MFLVAIGLQGSMHVTSLGFIRLYFKGSLADLEGLRVAWWFMRAWGLLSLGRLVFLKPGRTR